MTFKSSSAFGALVLAACATAAPVASTPQAPTRANACARLASREWPGAANVAASMVSAGGFTVPGRGDTGAANPYATVPEFCRVRLRLAPSPDSDIAVEVWLPSAWNHKFQGVGNGGWAGTLSYPAMADAVRSGYATASTDTGHTGTGGAFALGHPEKLADFAWRAVHLMTDAAKQVTAAYYASAPTFAYWNGCSTGGRQGLKEAQQFPDDYDGIIAGAPANRTAIALWIAHAVHDPASYIPPEKYPLIHRAVLERCDALDGVTDGLIANPMACVFDPAVLMCPGADGPSCLTAPQVAAAKAIYSPATNPRTGRRLSRPLPPGTELGWGDDAGHAPNANILDQYRYIVFKDPNWDWTTFDFDRDADRGDLADNLPMNATDPNLSAFFARGGKLLMYQGWSDPRVPAMQTVDYYASVAERFPAQASQQLRLFMVPGMGHCSGGEGPNVFDKMGPLERWVEQGAAPTTIVASHVTAGAVDRTRPLCAYPQTARYKGAGSIDDAANFVCAAK